ncbi:MAG TPA: FtsQ-type POTRA domain-containing protein [Acidimicrobiia bacterium]|jgi:cell division protein FtsQ|nr:FtsQ-type POTRA domain-containing protein [Acidimicrobiia bacterium]
MTTTPTRVRINPRIRERRIEVQREAGRRRLRVLLVVSSVLSAVGLAFLVVTSPVLDVDHMPVAGALHVSVADVRAAAGVHGHDHLLFVDTGAVARRIERLPWVESASVQRDLPGTLKISIREYTPTAYVRVAGGVVLVASNGHVIARAKAPTPSAVEVRGVRQAPAIGAVLAPAEAAGVASRLPAALGLRISAVDVSGSGIALILAAGGQIRLGDASNLDAKAASALAVLAQLGSQHFSYIDVSTPDRPISHP